MKIVIQRVQSASVTIEDSTVGAIKQGLLLLVGVGPEDTKEDLEYAVRKIVNMRIFSDEDGKMNLSVKDIDGQILSISQFTLLKPKLAVIIFTLPILPSSSQYFAFLTAGKNKVHNASIIKTFFSLASSMISLLLS